MALDKNDLQSIKGVVVDVVDSRFTPFEKRIVSEIDRRLDEKITAFRTEVRALFTQQSDHLATAIADAVKLIAANHPTKEEFEDLKNEVEDLKEKVQALLGISRH